MRVRLSHRLDDAQPNWPGAPGLVRRPCHRLEGGDVANTTVLEIYSHYGTHVDLPFHVLPQGRTMSDYDLADFAFSKPVLVDLPLGDSELVGPRHLAPHEARLAGADLVLLRSGFERHRADRERYESRGPGFSDEAARWLRSRLPALRGVALDWLSLCALAAVDDGLAAHRTLLGPGADGGGVLVFEDVALAALGSRQPTAVSAFPLLVDGLDGSPCSMVADVP